MAYGKFVFKNRDLQMFGIKLNKYDQFSPTWVAVAGHNFKWVKILIIQFS